MDYGSRVRVLVSSTFSTIWLFLVGDGLSQAGDTDSCLANSSLEEP